MTKEAEIPKHYFLLAANFPEIPKNGHHSSRSKSRRQTVIIKLYGT